MKLRNFKPNLSNILNLEMRTKYVFCFLLILLLSNFTILQNNDPYSKYKEIFKDDYTDAVEYFQENYHLFHDIFSINNADENILIPVVFPERIRYNVIRNYLETEALKLLYTEYGSKTVDFSIGDLQMKPSFAENIENRISNDPFLKLKYVNLIIEAEDNSKNRKERVRRLELLPYQIQYLSAFYDIVKLTFDLSEMNHIDKIKFIASAYNHGFDSSKKRIEEHINVKYFPYGKKYPGKQYAYTDIAVDFYQTCFSEIKK